MFASFVQLHVLAFLFIEIDRLRISLETRVTQRPMKHCLKSSCLIHSCVFMVLSVSFHSRKKESHLIKQNGYFVWSTDIRKYLLSVEVLVCVTHFYVNKFH